MSLPLCSVCRARPVWFDSSNNRPSQYCSKTCRRSSQASFHTPQPSTHLQNPQQQLPFQYPSQNQQLPQQSQGNFIPTQGPYSPQAQHFHVQQTPAQPPTRGPYSPQAQHFPQQTPAQPPTRGPYSPQAQHFHVQQTPAHLPTQGPYSPQAQHFHVQQTPAQLPIQGPYSPQAQHFHVQQTPYTSSFTPTQSSPGTSYFNGFQTTGQNCAQCLQNPAIFIQNKASPFCSRHCANAHKNIASPSNAPYYLPNTPQAPSPQQAPYGVPQGQVHTNIGHMTMQITNAPLQAFSPVSKSSEMCLECGISGKWIENGRVLDWCGKKCKTNANAKAPTIYLLDPTSATYKNVANQFTGAWANGSGKHNIHLIWKIHSSQATGQAYEAYRQSVESNRNCNGRRLTNGKFMTAGNEQRRWHGTSSIACEIGYTKGNNKICKSSTCAVCRIVETSYRISHAKAGGLMGQGIYFSAAASKSHGYNSGSTKVSGGKSLRCMFLNKVVVGNTKKYTTHTQVDKNSLGAQFDSVCLDSSFCDEVVVFEERACLPTYLIVYES